MTSKKDIKMQCRKCQRELSLDSFHRCSKGKYGRRKICKECRKEESRIYHKKNKGRWQKSQNERRRQQRKKGAQYKFKELLRNRIRRAITRFNIIKSGKTRKLLGADLDVVKKHLESLFQEGMTWENHGRDGWYIDHIVPCASFDLTDPEQQKKCFHYTNLQPLWGWQNLSKGCREGKSCTECKNWKPFDDFPRSSFIKDGYRSQCKECINRRSREYKRKNKKYISDYNRKYKIEHQEEVSEYNYSYC